MKNKDVVMKKGFWKASVLGGIVVFVWGVISWMVLPWHMETSHQFTDEHAVATVLEENTPVSGIYFLPNCHKHTAGETAEEIKSSMEAAKSRMKQGPLLFVSIHKEGMDPESVRPFIGSLLIQIIAAIFATGLLLQTKALPYIRRVWFVCALGVFAGVVSTLPDWNWMSFSLGWTVVTFLDLAIGWFLAGLVIAKLAKK